MSVFSYIAGDKSRTKMPRSEQGRPDEVGIRFQGPVLTGMRSVGEELARRLAWDEDGERRDPLLRDQHGRRL